MEQPNNVLLPMQFKDLAPLVADWALASEEERFAKRVTSDMASIRALHDAMMPRIEAILDYLDRFPLEALPQEARPLLFLALSFAEVAPSVYFYDEPVPADVLEPKRFRRWRVPNMTPD